MTLAAWVSPHPVTVQASASLRDAVRTMAEHRIGAVLVTEGERLVGIFTERDLVRVLSEDPARALASPIREFMTPDPICAEAFEDADAVYAKMQRFNIRHIPIVDGESAVGIVSIRDLTRHYQHRLETEFLEARRRIEELERVAELRRDERLRVLIEEVNRYKELAVTDPLTGLYNKRYFMARLREEVARAERYGERLSLIFCDVDHFKEVNDNYGHAAGDLVLQQIASILAGTIDRFDIAARLRKSDIVARYGGEEFVAILPQTPLAGASRAAEKIRCIVEEHRFRFDGSSGSVTMSFGVAEHQRSGTPDDLIRDADTALYAAKVNGRNRVEVYQPRSP